MAAFETCSSGSFKFQSCRRLDLLKTKNTVYMFGMGLGISYQNQSTPLPETYVHVELG